ncbi:hypothetical protein AB9M93_26150 [Peribacillus frigoritolerans]|uniref:hypothetical protein n=1 Tax=Peribacillus frigoritolerans TaxID=450367 RepID=UPI00351765EF
MVGAQGSPWRNRGRQCFQIWHIQRRQWSTARASTKKKELTGDELETEYGKFARLDRYQTKAAEDWIEEMKFTKLKVWPMVMLKI